jgi:predicted Ser/Thr protein kinase/tetratricopeptide (TPR) repeat protein
MMTPERYARIRTVFGEALDREGFERTQYLDATCAGDEELRREVDTLLATIEANPDFMTTPHPIAAGADITGITADRPDQDPERIGRFSIVRRIGEGGMGVVFEAEQDEPKRRVALKVLRPGALGRSALRRFRYEAQVLGMLQHPGIAQIYEAGAVETAFGPQPYIAMEYVEGRRITDYADEHAPTVADRLGLVIALCEAVQHAHDRGVIHRDIKSSNILVSDDGRVKVLDFGVARAASTEAQATTTFQTDLGQIIGTLSYMSPEQAAGDSASLDVRTDVYALGVICFELISGQLPIDLKGRSLIDAVRAVEEEPPLRLSAIDATWRGDLDTILEKALAKESDRRYGSPAAFADDLRRYLSREPIAARPASTAYQLRCFARRNRALVTVATTAVVLLVAALVYMSWLAFALAHARDDVRAEAEKARQVSAYLETALLGGSARFVRTDVTMRDNLDVAAHQLGQGDIEDPEVEAKIRLVIANAYNAVGASDYAKRHLVRARELLLEVHAPDHPEIRKISDNIAAIDAFTNPETTQAEFANVMLVLPRLISQHQEGEALEALPQTEVMARKGLAFYQLISDVKPGGMIKARTYLAIVLSLQGRHAEALELLDAALVDCDALDEFREEDESIGQWGPKLRANVLLQRGIDLQALGRTDEAEHDLLAALDAMRSFVRRGGYVDTTVLADMRMMYGSLATLYDACERTDDAAETLRRSERIIDEIDALSEEARAAEAEAESDQPDA